MLERYFFDAWMYLVMDPYTNDFNYKNEYAVNIGIVQYIEKARDVSVDMAGAVGNSVANFTGMYNAIGPFQGKLNNENFTSYTIDCNYASTLLDAFPIAINSQELGYDNNNAIQKVSVTFSYKFAVPFDDKGSSTGTSIRSASGNAELFSEQISLK
jgi:hypothetical protein